jgi:acetyl-CoA/propionyl-CoA carboxylase carboxyl transferase subunit
MGPQGAVNILYDDELEAAENPEERREELIEEYREEFANPYTAADKGFLDAVIEPPETRARLVDDLEMLESKRDSLPDKKHGNIPL